MQVHFTTFFHPESQLAQTKKLFVGAATGQQPAAENIENVYCRRSFPNPFCGSAEGRRGQSGRVPELVPSEPAKEPVQIHALPWRARLCCYRAKASEDPR